MRMRSNTLAIITMCASAMALMLSCSKTPSGSSGTEDPTPAEFASWMGAGWNLGNSLDAHSGGKSDELCWGNGASTQKTFDAVKSMGFGCVRIPVTWMGHMGAAPDYKVDQVWMDRVAEVALYAKKAGLKAIINVHHDGADSKYWFSLKNAASSPERRKAIGSQYKALWSQIATRFKNEGQWLIFETMNEVHDGDWGSGANNYDGGLQYEIINEWNQMAVDAIRAAGGENAKRYIAVAGYAANVNLTATSLVLPNDPAQNRLVVAVHSYDPWEYAGLAKYSEWGHTGNASKMAPKSREGDYTSMLNTLVNKYISKGIPVYMGECGCVHRATQREENFRKYYLEFTVKAMKDRGIVPIVWDNGSKGTGEESFGLVNHADGSYINNAAEIVKIITGTWNNNSPSYTLESVLQKAPL